MTAATKTTETPEIETLRVAVLTARAEFLAECETPSDDSGIRLDELHRAYKAAGFALRDARLDARLAGQ